MPLATARLGSRRVNSALGIQSQRNKAMRRRTGTFVRNVHSGSRTTYSQAMHVLHERLSRPGYLLANPLTFKSSLRY